MERRQQIEWGRDHLVPGWRDRNGRGKRRGKRGSKNNNRYLTKKNISTKNRRMTESKTKSGRSKDDKIKSLERKIENLESGTNRRFKDVADVQAAIGRNAILFQRVRAYILAAIIFLFGLGLLIWNSVDAKDTGNYIIASALIFTALAIVMLMNAWSGFVMRNKNAAIYNAFVIETKH